MQRFHFGDSNIVVTRHVSHSDQMIKYHGTSQLVESEPLERPYQEILYPAKKFFEK